MGNCDYLELWLVEFFYPFIGFQVTIFIITAIVKSGQEAVPGNICLLRATSVDSLGYPANSGTTGSHHQYFLFTSQFWTSLKHPKEGGQEGVSKEQEGTSLLSLLPGNLEIHVSARLWCGMP